MVIEAGGSRLQHPGADGAAPGHGATLQGPCLEVAVGGFSS